MYNLIVSDGLKMRDEYPLKDQITIVGRDQEKCQIFLDSKKVSRQHFRIILKSNKVYIEDLGSSNGVSINDTKVEKIQQISEDDVLHFGEFYAQLNNTNKIKRSYQIDEVIASKKKEYEKLTEKPYFKLVSRDKRYPGLSFEIDFGTVTVGRTKVSNIVIPSKSLSKKHFQFKRDGKSLIVEDLGSINGTYANGRRVRKPVYLKHGDQLLIGDLEFAIESNIDAYIPVKKVNKVPIIIGVLIVVPILILLPKLFKSKEEVVKEIAPINSNVETIEDKIHKRDLQINGYLGRAEEAAKLAKWEDAISNLKEVRNLDPANQIAITRTNLYNDELKNKKIYADAQQAFGLGDYKLARKLSMEIKDTSYYSQYAKLLEQKSRETLISRYLQDAKTYRRAKHFVNAYGSLKELFTLTPHHEEAAKLKEEIEKDVKHYRVKIVPFKIQDVTIKTAKTSDDMDMNKIKEIFPEHETQTAIKQFLRGDIIYAMRFLREIGVSNANYAKSQALLIKLQKYSAENSQGNQNLTKKSYIDAEKHFAEALKIEKELLKDSGLESRYASQMKSQLSQGFNAMGKDEYRNGRFKQAFQLFQKSYKYNAQNMANLEDLSRIQRRAQTLWQESLNLERQGSSNAFDKWKEIVDITTPESMLHKSAQKKLAQ